MPITINGSGTVTGISAGGLPDDCITTAEIAANAVTTAKLGSSEASGLAKAWVNFNGTGAVAIRASFNVSSITDNGVGNYNVNFTTALVTSGFAMCGTAASDGIANNGWVATGNFTTTYVSAFVISGGTSAGNLFDSPTVCVAIFR